MTIFALTPAEQRRGDLMSPGGGEEGGPFQRFINTASVYRDVARTSHPMIRSNPKVVKAMTSAPHDRGCVHQFLFEVLAQIEL